MLNHTDTWCIMNKSATNSVRMDCENELVVEPEYLACVLIAIILGNSLFDHGAPSLKTTTFRASLFISFAAIFTNLIAIYLMQYAYKFPVSLLYTVNMIYFLLVPVMIGSIGGNVCHHVRGTIRRNVLSAGDDDFAVRYASYSGACFSKPSNRVDLLFRCKRKLCPWHSK